MKIGLSVTSAYRVTNPREGPQRMIARVRAAGEAGLDSLFVGDHHTTAAPYYQNTPMLGRLLADWHGPVAGALFLLPLWNPVLVAEQTATLACLHRGRFVMQCGLGSGEASFAAMGAGIKTRPSAFEQALATIRRLWAGETLSLEGRWQLRNARIAPTPPEPIEVWIGASAAVAIDRAARLGDVWLADPGMTPPQAQAALDTYEAALNKHNRPTPARIAIRRDIYVAESRRDADEAGRLARDRGYRGIDPAALIIGDPEAVAEAMLALGRVGYTDIIVRNLHPDPRKAVDSTSRLGGIVRQLA